MKNLPLNAFLKIQLCQIKHLEIDDTKELQPHLTINGIKFKYHRHLPSIEHFCNTKPMQEGGQQPTYQPTVQTSTLLS